MTSSQSFDLMLALHIPKKLNSVNKIQISKSYPINLETNLVSDGKYSVEDSSTIHFISSCTILDADKLFRTMTLSFSCLSKLVLSLTKFASSQKTFAISDNMQ